jgi:hypothetical protein
MRKVRGVKDEELTLVSSRSHGGIDESLIGVMSKVNGQKVNERL